MNKYLLTLGFSVSCAMALANEYRIKILVGDQMQEALPLLAELRLSTFREYPYLYDGTIEEEQAYCKELVTFKHAAIAVVYWGDKQVGVLSGASLVDYSRHFGEVEGFRAAGYAPNAIYYFGEGIILPEHRNKHVGTEIYKQLEAWVIAQGYTHGCFISESYENHPLKPKNYKEHDSQWRRLGYEKTTIAVTYAWKTWQPDGTSRIQDHSMPYWIKQFKS